MPKTIFESWCQRRREKHILANLPNGHESAGPIMQALGTKNFYGDYRFVLPVEGVAHPIELHVCKHCGCVFAEVRP